MVQPFAIFVLDTHGVIQSVSEPLCALTGLSERELVGRELVSLLAGDPEPSAALVRSLVQGDHLERVRCLLRIRAALTIAVTLTAAPLRDAQGRVSGAACVVSEASAHHAFQPAERQDLPILRATLESTADAILVIDSSFQVVTCNHKFEELWGLPSGWAAMPEYRNLLEVLKRRVRDPEAFVRRVQEIYRDQVDTAFELFEMLDGRIIERFSSAYHIDGRIGGRVWNYRDRTDLERAHYEIQALKTITEALNRATTPHDALADGLATVAQVFGARAGWIRVIEETGEVSLAAQHTPPGWSDGDLLASPRPLCPCLWDICAGHPAATEVCTCEQLKLAGQTAYVTPYQIAILIQAGGQTTGVLLLLEPMRRAYSDVEARLFEAISSHLGLALERARLFAAEQAQRRTAETLYQVTSAFNQTIEIAVVLQNVVRLSVEVVGAGGGFLGLLSDDGAELSLAHSFNFDPTTFSGSLKRGAGMSWSVVESGEASLINTYAAHPRALPEIVSLGVQAVIAVPVPAGQQCLGVLTIFSTRPGQRFTRHDLALLESVGRQAGIAIQNARLYEEVQSLAIQDSLTGLYNQRYLFSVGAKEYDRAVRYRHPLAVLVLDVDHFKRVNDTYGHDIGNVVLQAVAQSCRDQLRTSDIVARYGGEEFVLLLVETGLAEALRVAERLCASIERTSVETERGLVGVTVSIGVAALGVGKAASSLNGLLQQADMALYEAKRSGRNRVCFRAS